jgi:hypothetical protein
VPADPGDGTVGGVTVLERALLGPHGPTSDLPRGVPVTLRARLRFDTEVDSPQVHFTVLAEDRTVVYEMRSRIGHTHRAFRAGEVADAEIAFTPQLAGGSFRFVLTVTSRDGRHVLHRDPSGLLVYVPPPLGTSGVADLDATITLDGEVLTDHPDVSL